MNSLFEVIGAKKEIVTEDVCEIRPYVTMLMNTNWKSPLNMESNRPFPFESNFLECYEGIIEKHFLAERNAIQRMVSTREGESYQVFEAEVSLGESSGYIRYLFPLPPVQTLIRQYDIQAQEIEVDVLYEYSAYVDIDKSYHVSDEPVIAMQYPYAEPGFFVLDGNHRVVKAREQGKGQIRAYLLREDAMLLLAPQPIFYMLYLLHKNLTNIRLYMEGYIELAELRDVYVQLNNENWHK